MIGGKKYSQKRVKTQRFRNIPSVSSKDNVSLVADTDTGTALFLGLSSVLDLTNKKKRAKKVLGEVFLRDSRLLHQYRFSQTSFAVDEGRNELS